MSGLRFLAPIRPPLCLLHTTPASTGPGPADMGDGKAEERGGGPARLLPGAVRYGRRGRSGRPGERRGERQPGGHLRQEEAVRHQVRARHVV